MIIQVLKFTSNHIISLLRLAFILPRKENWWKHKPSQIAQNKATIHWNQRVQTKRETQANRPNIMSSLKMATIFK